MSTLNLEIKKIIRETNSVTSLLLQARESDQLNFTAGQFVTLLFNLDEEEIRRSFSISSSPLDLPQLRITIKRAEDGLASKHFLDEVKTGEIIKAFHPTGNFTIKIDPDKKRNAVFIGAGSGITPLYSMIKTILAAEPQGKIALIYGNRNESLIIFKDEIDMLAKAYKDSLQVEHFLSRPQNSWNGHVGRITKENLISTLKSLANIGYTEAEYYLCGPEGMMQSAAYALNELGINHHHIHTENFDVQLLCETDRIEEIEREVTIIFRDEEHKINIKPGESILLKALSLGLELPNSCQAGNCGTCRAKLLSGKIQLIEQTALSEEDIKNGYCLTCVGHAASDDVVILYEEPFE
ncbi:MAG: ferredoxin--NADP reductase [Ignavibacteriales bacterium]|nr:ferredoxin--NADP reductase [Ignavibacteriales bacterium]